MDVLSDVGGGEMRLFQQLRDYFQTADEIMQLARWQLLR
jgi:hypothetical protein